MYMVELWGCCQCHTEASPARFTADATTLADAKEEALGYLYWAGATAYRVTTDTGTEVAKQVGIDPMPF